MADNDEVEPRKPTFSQRHGFADYSAVIQADSLNERTRTDLWNFAIHPFCIGDLWTPMTSPLISPEMVWVNHLARPTDKYHSSPYFNALHEIAFDGEWYRVYDLVEFLVQNIGDYRQERLAGRINAVLALNRAGYRVVNGYVVPITNEAELSSIEGAIASPLSGAGEHIKRALALFADRENPNYAKAIQEAISAAESAAQVLAGQRGITLGKALTVVERQQPPVMHPALLKGWGQMYGFTSDNGGIRHALHEGTAPLAAGLNLAQYFIISCSAFVNLVAAIKADDE
jgi:hypothetical protein